jgi:hypothetical protein
MGHIYIYNIYYGKRLRDIRILEKKTMGKVTLGFTVPHGYQVYFFVHGTWHRYRANEPMNPQFCQVN